MMDIHRRVRGLLAARNKSGLIDTDFSFQDDGEGPYIKIWAEAKLGPKPTVAELQATAPAPIQKQFRSALDEIDALKARVELIESQVSSVR